MLTQTPWGHQILWAHTENYVGKILHINKGHRLSRQYHIKKDETIYVLEGTLRLEVGGSDQEILHLTKGQSYHITPRTIHRFCALEDSPVTLAEVSTTELLDVVRLEDDYNRI